jgi:putative nucleotidyltransferase with HDIG domain/PAS domain S-box-containing protein
MLTLANTFQRVNTVAVGADGSRRKVGISTVRLWADDTASPEMDAYLDTLLTNAPAGLLFVDREFRYLRVNQRVAAIHGSASVEKHLGHTVAEVVPTLWPQLEGSYRSVLESGVPVLDVRFSGPSAEDVGRRHHWLESIYPVRLGDEIIGLAVVVIDVTVIREQEATLVTLTEAAVDAIAAAAEARDPYTAGHQQRVAELSVAIARELSIGEDDIDGIRMAARIHDIGKLSTPSEILTKPGALRPSELALVREHAQTGYDIIRGIAFPWPVADMILQHHERLDGTGYPNGLHGDEIMLGARIIAVADVVEAMSSHRPYRPSRGLDVALNVIADDRGHQYDPDVVRVCLRLFRGGGFMFSLQDDDQLDRD